MAIERGLGGSVGKNKAQLEERESRKSSEGLMFENGLDKKAERGGRLGILILGPRPTWGVDGVHWASTGSGLDGHTATARCRPRRQARRVCTCPAQS